MRKIFMLCVLVLSACGSDEKVSARPDVSYATIQPAAGVTYPEFRKHERWGEGDMRDVQKRFLVLDRDNNGRLTPDEIGE